VTLTFELMTPELLSVIPDVGNVFCQFERCMIFRLKVNYGGHVTDGQTGGV